MQNSLISLKRYLTLCSLRPSGMILEGMPLGSLRMRMSVVDFLSEKNSFDTTAPKTSQIRSLNTPNKTYEFFPPLG